MSYTTYSNLLNSVQDQLLNPRTYEPIFYGGQEQLSSLGKLRKYATRISIALLPSTDKDGLKWAVGYSSLTLEEGLERFYTTPVTKEQIYDIVRKQHSSKLSYNNNFKMFLAKFKEKMKVTDEQILDIGNYYELSLDEGRIYIRYIPSRVYHKAGFGIQRGHNCYTLVALGKWLMGNFLMKDVDVEFLVDQAKISLVGGDVMFELVSGDAIAKWYHQKNYHTKFDIGDLRNSCMRYDKCQSYFGLYTENTQVQLLIATEGGKLIGRTLVWSNGKDRFVDRIYGSRIVQWAIWDFAKKLGIKPRDDLYGTTINLDQTDFEKYPYLDTLHYVNLDTNQASNRAVGNRFHRRRYLMNTNGTYLTA